MKTPQGQEAIRPDVQTAETTRDEISGFTMSQVITQDVHDQVTEEQLRYKKTATQVDQSTALLQNQVLANDTLSDFKQENTEKYIIDIVQNILQSNLI